MDLDNPEDQNVEEIKDPEHNAPERIMDDLYFFDDVSEEEALVNSLFM